MSQKLVTPSLMPTAFGPSSGLSWRSGVPGPAVVPQTPPLVPDLPPGLGQHVNAGSMADSEPSAVKSANDQPTSYSSAVRMPAKRVCTTESDLSEDSTTSGESDGLPFRSQSSPTFAKMRRVNPNIVESNARCVIIAGSDLGLH